MTAEELIGQLKKWGVRYRPVQGWRRHNRNAVGAWGPVHGVGIHHTGDDAPDGADRRIVHDGRPDLPGPLAQFGCNDDGVIDLIGWGRANHFGGGDASVFAAVVEESYGDYPPKPHMHEGSPGAVDGNCHFYGVETYYAGGRPPTAKAYRSLVLLAAAICDFHGWSAKSVIGHKEWSDQKSDPGRVDMRQFRAEVAGALRAGPHPDPWVDIDRARVELENGLTYLDQAVAHGADGKVKAARDHIRAELSQLTKG